MNDVYEIDNMPHLATARRLEAERVEPATGAPVAKTICVLPGDFVAPSLLSSLDKGMSMIGVC